MATDAVALPHSSVETLLEHCLSEAMQPYPHRSRKLCYRHVRGAVIIYQMQRLHQLAQALKAELVHLEVPEGDLEYLEKLLERTQCLPDPTEARLLESLRLNRRAVVLAVSVIVKADKDWFTPVVKWCESQYTKYCGEVVAGPFATQLQHCYDAVPVMRELDFLMQGLQAALKHDIAAADTDAASVTSGTSSAAGSATSASTLLTHLSGVSATESKLESMRQRCQDFINANHALHHAAQEERARAALEARHQIALLEEREKVTTKWVMDIKRGAYRFAGVAIDEGYLAERRLTEDADILKHIAGLLDTAVDKLQDFFVAAPDQTALDYVMRRLVEQQERLGIVGGFLMEPLCTTANIWKRVDCLVIDLSVTGFDITFPATPSKPITEYRYLAAGVRVILRPLHRETPDTAPNFQVLEGPTVTGRDKQRMQQLMGIKSASVPRRTRAASVRVFGAGAGAGAGAGGTLLPARELANPKRYRHQHPVLAELRLYLADCDLTQPQRDAFLGYIAKLSLTASESRLPQEDKDEVWCNMRQQQLQQLFDGFAIDKRLQEEVHDLLYPIIHVSNGKASGWLKKQIPKEFDWLHRIGDGEVTIAGVVLTWDELERLGCTNQQQVVTKLVEYLQVAPEAVTTLLNTDAYSYDAALQLAMHRLREGLPQYGLSGMPEIFRAEGVVTPIAVAMNWLVADDSIMLELTLNGFNVCLNDSVRQLAAAVTVNLFQRKGRLEPVVGSCTGPKQNELSALLGTTRRIKFDFTSSCEPATELYLNALKFINTRAPVHARSVLRNYLVELLLLGFASTVDPAEKFHAICRTYGVSDDVGLHLSVLLWSDSGAKDWQHLAQLSSPSAPDFAPLLWELDRDDYDGDGQSDSEYAAEAGAGAGAGALADDASSRSGVSPDVSTASLLLGLSVLNTTVGGTAAAEYSGRMSPVQSSHNVSVRSTVPIAAGAGAEPSEGSSQGSASPAFPVRRVGFLANFDSHGSIRVDGLAREDSTASSLGDLEESGLRMSPVSF